MRKSGVPAVAPEFRQPVDNGLLRRQKIRVAYSRSRFFQMARQTFGEISRRQSRVLEEGQNRARLCDEPVRALGPLIECGEMAVP